LRQLFVLRLDHQRYALRLPDVERVLRMVEITALPEPPPGVLGVINVQGRVLTVIDLRHCLHLPAREVEPEDVLILVSAAGAMLALAADGVEGVTDWPEEGIIPVQEIRAPSPYLEGVAKLADGLVLIFDLGRLLRPATTVIPSAPAGGDSAG